MALSCIYARGITISHQAVALSAKSAFGLYQQLNTFCVFHQMNHHILGLSSRSVSLTRYNLTFRTCSVAAENEPSVTIHGVIFVQDVELVSARVNVNSCQTVVAVSVEE